MMGSMQAVLALSVGYLLGWRRTATVLAAAAVAGCLSGLGGAAVRRGMKMPGQSWPGSPAGRLASSPWQAVP